MNAFAGKALPLDSNGIQASLDVLEILAADLWAVIGVETSGCGFLSDRRVKILFERHVFSQLTDRRYDVTNPALSNPTPGGMPEFSATLLATMGISAGTYLGFKFPEK